MQRRSMSWAVISSATTSWSTMSGQRTASFLPGVDVSRLRYYSAENGDYLSCIFANVPHLPANINLEIIFECSTREEHAVVFGSAQ